MCQQLYAALLLHVQPASEMASGVTSSSRGFNIPEVSAKEKYILQTSSPDQP